MSPDPFTRSARAEAEGRFPLPRESAVVYPVDAVRSHSRVAFLTGAEWARDYLDERCGEDPSGPLRPLTPDAITDEMVERARKAIAEKSGGDFTPGEVRTYNILAAALTEPPARPEGAEEWEDWLIEALPHESMPDEDIARLADQITARITEKNGDPR